MGLPVLLGIGAAAAGLGGTYYLAKKSVRKEMKKLYPDEEHSEQRAADTSKKAHNLGAGDKVKSVNGETRNSPREWAKKNRDFRR